jgi:eukaryotic-like serine/threonine-protein kinase
MPLPLGTMLGPYEIQSSLGAGGMGEVYRARDTRLDRTVAIKILPAHLSDPVSRQRFEREAKIISGLNHPNICVLHDVGSQNGVDYLVMECVEGETLAKRLERGSLPLEQVLKYGAQIADALNKAHVRGVIHRDLKPGNIMLTPAGAKLMDFGLAKPVSPVASPATMTAAAPQQSPITEQGTIIGTFQYMSPEQIEGKDLDNRSDIFSFGAALYEMLAGQRAFQGKSQLSVASAILEKEPDPISNIKPMTPPALDHTIRKCLAKVPEERWQSASDLAGELRWIAEGAPHAVAGSGRRKNNPVWILASFLLMAALAALTFAYFHRSPSPAPTIRFAFAPPENTSVETAMAFSPDGQILAFVVASRDGKDLIWSRRMSDSSAAPLAGTEGATFPFWSPDSRYLGFFADRKLKVVPASGGTPRVLCDVLDGRGASWGSQGDILFAPHWRSALYRISAAGGEAHPASELLEGQYSQRLPVFLPDGQHFLYYAQGIDSAHEGLYWGALEDKKGARIAGADSFAGYAAPGFLVFVQGGRLISQPFDVRALHLTGDATSLAESVLYDVDFPQSYAFAVSPGGSVAFRNASTKGNELVWFDRKGTRLKTLAQHDDYSEPAISHDGRFVAVCRKQEIVLINLATGATAGLVADGAYSPTWSPDDKRIIFSLKQRGRSDIFLQEIGGTGSARLLLSTNSTKDMMDWSHDGRFITWDNTDTSSQTRADIFVMNLDNNEKPRAFLGTPFEDSAARFSPDGRWLLYTSDESGREEIYVRAFPDGGGKLPISIRGGSEPFWRGDGKEIFYLTPDRKLMAVALKSGAKHLEPQSPVELFNSPIHHILNARNHYVPTADGQRFLLVADLAENQNSPVTVVLNFPAGPNPR